MSDDYETWRRLLAGEKGVPLHEEEPVCGYFRLRDRRGKWLNAAPIKRPWIGCAIWRGPDGNLLAEFDAEPVQVTDIWPWCAKNPVTYEAYRQWHDTFQWPEKAA